MAAFPDQDELDRDVLSIGSEEDEEELSDMGESSVVYERFFAEIEHDGQPYSQLSPDNRLTRQSMKFTYVKLFEEGYASYDQVAIQHDKTDHSITVDFGSEVTHIQMDLVLEAILNIHTLKKITIRNLSNRKTPNAEELFFTVFYTILYETRPDVEELYIRDPFNPVYNGHAQEINYLLRSSNSHLRVVDIAMSSKFDNNDVKTIAKGIVDENETVLNTSLEVLRIQGNTGMDENCLHYLINPVKHRYLHELKVFWYYKRTDLLSPMNHTNTLKRLYRAIDDFNFEALSRNYSLNKFDYYQQGWLKNLMQMPRHMRARLDFFDQSLVPKFEQLHNEIIFHLRYRRLPHAAGKKYSGCKKHACCEYNDDETEKAVANYRYLQQIIRNGGHIRIEYE